MNLRETVWHIPNRDQGRCHVCEEQADQDEGRALERKLWPESNIYVLSRHYETAVDMCPRQVARRSKATHRSRHRPARVPLCNSIMVVQFNLKKRLPKSSELNKSQG